MSKTKKSRIGKQKLTRNILIGVAIAAVIAVAIFLVVALQKDGAGFNCFQRSATAASANGVRATMSEYRIAYDTTVSNYTTSSFTDAQIRTLQENAARQVLLQKVYKKQAKALGLSLTDEQAAASKKTAQDQLDSIEAYFADYLIDNGSYSKSALEKQLTNYYQQLGMSKTAYYNLLKESAEASYYEEAIEAYYEEKGSDIAEADLLAFYKKSVEDSMYTTDENGNQVATYEEGNFWYYLMLYGIGYSSPMLYVPDGFIYVDFIEVNKESTEEAADFVAKVSSGEIDFDELLVSDDNTDTYRNTLTGPYPIAEHDHSQLFADDEAFHVAEKLEIGEIGSFVSAKTNDEGETTSVTVYLFRRAKGTMCMDGETGVIDIDYFPGIRHSAEDEYRLEQWMGEIKYEDALYAYKGALG